MTEQMLQMLPDYSLRRDMLTGTCKGSQRMHRAQLTTNQNVSSATTKKSQSSVIIRFYHGFLAQISVSLTRKVMIE